MQPTQLIYLHDREKVRPPQGAAVLQLLLHQRIDFLAEGAAVLHRWRGKLSRTA